MMREGYALQARTSEALLLIFPNWKRTTDNGYRTTDNEESQIRTDPFPATLSETFSHFYSPKRSELCRIIGTFERMGK
jgi:hypothetical protein